MSFFNSICDNRRTGGLAVAFKSFRRESRNGLSYAAWWFSTRFYLRFVKPRLPSPAYPNVEDTRRRLTIIVPAVEKDASVLGQCVRSLRAMIQHQITEVWIVAPESNVIRQIAAAENCCFIHEDTILPLPAKELNCRGWVLQQFIKLNVANHVLTADYLVVDSDTVFLRPQSFFRRGKAVLRYADQYELLYNRSLEMVFGHSRRYPVSFVTHHMLFSSEMVKALLQLIEQRFGCPWWEAILKEVDQRHPISFSEYELYGHFLLSLPQWGKRFCLEYWHGLDRHTEDLVNLDTIRRSSAGRLNTVSYHYHTQ